MKLSDFDFALPEGLIALRPAEPRSSARLLVVTPNNSPEIHDLRIPDLTRFLRRGDVMVFNDTRVIPARLRGIRERGGVMAKVEIMLHKREGEGSWLVFAKPGKRLATGDIVRFPAMAATDLSARVLEKTPEGQVLLAFDRKGPELDQAIVQIGEMPLPPYIAQKRPTDARDGRDYQTVYAAHDGAVAAPTAGLHFTPELLERIDAMGVSRCCVTLHVGAGTFLPVKAETISDHVMHAEWGRVSRETAAAVNAARAAGGRVIAVGTTSLRLLESAADDSGHLPEWSGDTSIFITPGHQFRLVDMLMTNFHLPKSTLMMLVSAFAGHDRMRQAYAHAIATGYRFYSYGDSSLLHRA